jgi:hypothetical protein
MMPAEAVSVCYCGRIFSAEELERIRGLIASKPERSRNALSVLVCEQLGWLRPDGRPKDMSCRVAMLRMHRDGWITLPPRRKPTGGRKPPPPLTEASAPREPFTVSEKALEQIALRPIEDRKDSSLWNELIERYHYLGHEPLPGAQLRYLVWCGPEHVAALGFGASAWKVAPRDSFIGWSAQERQRNLHLIVNNARFLILPWVQAPNLASRILSLSAKRLPQDWQVRYGYKPVLLETFVERDRFRGTCYRAANWIHVGQTQGRGKLDRKKQRLLPVKDIFLYPLDRRFRRILRSAGQIPERPSASSAPSPRPAECEESLPGACSCERIFRSRS